MLVNLFGIIVVMGFILHLYACEKSNVANHLITLMSWLVIMVLSAYIQDINGNVYIESAFVGFAFMFIFLHLVYTVYAFMDWKNEQMLVR